jgi:hypothetical protein
LLVPRCWFVAVFREKPPATSNALRDKVPAQHRAQFDELLEEARFTYRMRDERGYNNDAWSTGITLPERWMPDQN